MNRFTIIKVMYISFYLIGQLNAQTNQVNPQIALSPIKPSGSSVSEEEANVISDRFRAELFSTGKVNIMERAEMDQILKEQGFQQSGACNDKECLVQMGQVLGVNKILSGSIGRLGKLLTLNFRMIDVQTAKIEKVVTRDISGDIEGVITILQSMAYEMVDMELPKGKQYRIPVSNNLKRKFRLCISSDFLLAAFARYDATANFCLNPGLSLNNKHYFGIDLNLGDLLGGNLDYSYELHYKDILTFYPGVLVGLFDNYYNSVMITVGFRAPLEIGYKYVFFKLSPGMAIPIINGRISAFFILNTGISVRI